MRALAPWYYGTPEVGDALNVLNDVQEVRTDENEGENLD